MNWTIENKEKNMMEKKKKKNKRKRKKRKRIKIESKTKIKKKKQQVFFSFFLPRKPKMKPQEFIVN